MLPAWATVVLVLGASLISGLAALLAPVVQEGLRARRDAEKAASERRRKAIALVIAVRSAVEEAELQGYALNTSRKHFEYLQELMGRLADVRDELLALAAEEPDDALVDETRDVFAGARGAVRATALAVEEMIAGKAPSEIIFQAATTRQPEALEKVDALLDRFRRS